MVLPLLLELFQFWAGLHFHKKNGSGGGKRSAAISDLDKQSNCQILETENFAKTVKATWYYQNAKLMLSNDNNSLLLAMLQYLHSSVFKLFSQLCQKKINPQFLADSSLWQSQ